MDKKQIKILVADDEQDTLTVLKDALEDEGYEVFTASDGNEVLQLIECQRPELLILDLRMPGLDGERILKVISSEKLVPEMKVFVLTGFNDFNVTKERIKNRFAARVADYLEKPVDIHRLTTLIAGHLTKEHNE